MLTGKWNRTSPEALKKPSIDFCQAFFFFFFKRETILANPSKASFYRRSVFSNFHLAAFYVFLVIRLAQQNDSVWSCSNMGCLFVTTWSEPVRRVMAEMKDKLRISVWLVLNLCVHLNLESKWILFALEWYVSTNDLSSAAIFQVITWQGLFVLPDFFLVKPR